MLITSNKIDFFYESSELVISVLLTEFAVKSELVLFSICLKLSCKQAANSRISQFQEFLFSRTETMEVDQPEEEVPEIPGRWNHVQKLLTRTSNFAHPNFQPSPETLGLLQNYVNILVIGAGGLGCELLKDIALMGFKNITVIDMDTIDVSNLNRQFLFRQSDVGRYKAEVAAEFINKRIPGANVVAHKCPIQDFDEEFYRQFHIIVCGLDSIVARRWINGMVLSMVEYDENGQLDESRPAPPIVDGGTEGFKGNARVIIPGKSACIECTLDLFPPQVRIF